MGNLLKDKVAVVTGSGSGCGKAMVMAMAGEGAKVVVNDLGGTVDGSGSSISAADQVVQEIKKMGGTAVANYDSVATPEGGEKIIKTALDNFGRIDILVNNAGILRDRMIHNMSFEDWDAVIKVHLYGTFNCTKPAIVQMRQQNWGRIINISSIGGGGGGPIANPGQANYASAKAGIISFSRTVALEGARKGITCNVIFPSAPTRMTWSPAVQEAWKKRREAGALDPGTTGFLDKMERGDLKPEDLAPLAAYLASDAAGFITGCMFHVQGDEIRLYGEMLPIKAIYRQQKVWTVEEISKSVPKLVTVGLG